MNRCECEHPYFGKLTDPCETIVCLGCGGWKCITLHSVDELRAAHRLFTSPPIKPAPPIEDE